MTDLRLASDFALPLDAVTETFVIFAKRGSGKTYTGSVLVEELVGAGQPVCVVDPLGVWWGLRSSADGTGPGLPVVILGGDHADLPLHDESGAAVADLLIDERLPLVLDLSALSKSASRRFMAAFLERLYHRNREPLHLVIDEADLFAPQRSMAASDQAKVNARLLGAYEDVVRRGRARGLGCTSITQRPAVLHTDIRTQAEVLIALRMTGPRDVAALDEWVRLHADDDEARAVKASLPSLPVGTAWVWSPGWLQVLQRVQIRRRRTFDSSATPKPGQKVVQPREFAKVADTDLDRLRSRLGTSDAGAGEDPHGLAQLVEQLRRELAAERAKQEPERVEVAVVGEEQLVTLERLAGDLATVAGGLTEALGRVRQLTTLVPSAPAGPRIPATRHEQLPDGRPSKVLATEGSGLKAGARRIVETAARMHPLRVSRAQLATLVGLRITGGTWGTYFSEVRRRGLVAERDGLVEVTASGLEFAGVPAGAGPMTGEELRDQWYGVLKAGARTMLGYLLDAYPRGVSRGELAAHAGLEPSGGTFGTYLSTLRRNGLAEVDGDQIQAAQVFFLATPPTR